MNRSYSKLRHIQESNIILEHRRFNHYLMEQSGELNAIERNKKFNELIKMGDENLKEWFVDNLSNVPEFTLDNDLSFFDKEFTLEDMSEDAIGDRLYKYFPTLIYYLKKSEESYNEAKTLYTNPEVVNKKEFVGTSKEVKNNLSIVDEKINTIKDYINKLWRDYRTLRDLKDELGNKTYKKWLDDTFVKRFLDQGYKEVQEINLPDGDYNATGSGNVNSIYGPNCVKDDREKDFTGYVVVHYTTIRGEWECYPIKIVQKDWPEGRSFYKILFKDVGYIKK